MNYLTNDEILASKLPTFDTTWADEAKIAWLDMFMKILDLVRPGIIQQRRRRSVRIYERGGP